MKPVRDVMTKAEAARHCGVSTRTIERKLKPLPHKVRGRHGEESVYRRADVLKLAEEYRYLREVRPEVAAPEGATGPDVSHDSPDTPRALVRFEPAQFAAMIAQAIVTARGDVAPQAATQPPTGPTILDIAAKPLLKLDEAARLTGLSRHTLRRAIEEKKLKAKIVGRGWRIRREDLDAYLKRL